MSEETRKPTPEEKAKAAAEAKAKAEELRKQREEQQAAQANAAPSPDQSGANAEQAAPTPAGKETAAPAEDAAAKAKAAAAAKAKAAAAAAAAAKAKQAAQKDGAAQGTEAEEKPKPPSKNQPYLDKYVKLITERFGADVIEDAYINELAKEVPTLVIRNDKWHDVARFLKEEKELAFDYLSDLHGVDYEDRMEVYYHFYSYTHRQNLAVKVKTDREQPTVSSVSDIWTGADWNEREAFDLMGIHFPGHNNLCRIMLPDNWVGHPLRKDYVPYDEEV